jgi:uncharacterized protein (DUF1015 family)
MPRLSPFRGVRYSSSQQLANVTCPPYDVISPEQQAGLHERDPHNAVRLELAQTSSGGDDKYRDVAGAYESWLHEGVLERDPEPSFYVYRQDFRDAEGTRRRVAGVIGSLALEPFGTSAGVLPHERTMPGPKKDRLTLMRALPVNISPIYAIYRGAGELGPYFDSLEGRPTTGRFQDDEGILHRLWRITAPAEIQMLTDVMAPGPLVIADGHHRYETALAFHEEAAGGLPGSDSIMCLCVDADAEDLVVLPYNRVLRTDKGPGGVADGLRPLGARSLPAEDALPILGESSADHPFVFVLGSEDLLVELSDEDVVAVLGERAKAWRDLDVVALHEVLLPKVVGALTEVSFTKDVAEVRKRVDEGWSAGVLLRAMHASQIVEVAASGERMPQKASYFWPKAITGLVFHPLS